MYRIKAIFWLIVGLGFVDVYAQDPLAGQDTLILENERIEDVIDSDKPLLAPPAPEIPPPSVGDFRYNSLDVYMSTDFDPKPPDISPLPPGSTKALYHNMVKLTVGRFLTPRLDVFLNNGKDSNRDYGMQFTHHSAHSDEVTYRRFRENFLTGYASQQSGFFQYGGKAHIYNTSYFNYGDTLATIAENLEDGTELDQVEDSLRAGFTRLDISGFVKTLDNPDLPYRFDVEARLRYYGDRRENSEFHASIYPKGSLEFNEQLNLDTEIEFTYTRGDIGTSLQNRGFFKIIPAINFDNDMLRVRAGVIFNSYNNDQDVEPFSFFSPVGEVSYRLFPNELTIYVGYTPGMIYNHYYNMMGINRFMDVEVDIVPSIERVHVFGGVKGRVANRIDYSAKAFFRRVENALVYTVPPEGAYFVTSYDSLTEIAGITGEVIYHMTESIQIGGNVTFQNFNMSQLRRYFHETPLRTDAYIRYNWRDILTTQATLALYNQTPLAVSDADAIINRSSLALLNLTADFKIVDRVHAHLGIYNLFNADYVRWLNYEERPLDILGGFSIIF